MLIYSTSHKNGAIWNTNFNIKKQIFLIILIEHFKNVFTAKRVRKIGMQMAENVRDTNTKLRTSSSFGTNKRMSTIVSVGN